MHVVLCVTNDICTDRRVQRVAQTLLKLFDKVTIVGRAYRNSPPVSSDLFHIRRFRLLFHKGPLFYLEYNVRLFIHLVFVRAEVLVANDLDTLPAVYFASRIKQRKLVFDSHEYFTGVPELAGRRMVTQVWYLIERSLLPAVKNTYTVSHAIADVYREKYGISMQVIRNLPFRSSLQQAGKQEVEAPGMDLKASITGSSGDSVTRITTTEKVIVYQGSLNRGRGLENAIRAMHYLQGVEFWIIGTGDIENKLRLLVNDLHLAGKVHFMGRILPEHLIQYTSRAHLGISLEEGGYLNYRYALPNKLFDYIQAEIPVLVSDLPEMAAVVNQFDIGKTAGKLTPEELANCFHEMLFNDALRHKWSRNLAVAARELCWENEEKKLIQVFKALK